MKALANSLKIFIAFATNRGRWSVRDLVEHTGLSKSNVSKVLAEFREVGLLVQDPETRDYSVGLLAMALAGNYLASQRLVHEAIAPMRRLATELNNTVVLGVLDKGRVMHLLSVEGEDFVDVGVRVGSWLPLHASAVGKVLLTFASAEGESMLPAGDYERFTPNTITKKSALATQLKQVRKEGVAYADGEIVVGLGALGVPIFEQGGRVVASLGLVWSKHAVQSTSQIEGRVKRLQAAARQVSSRLGAEVYPFGGT